jgi:nucleotidyltransferase substrate binding protein (TIGR01987 family)
MRKDIRWKQRFANYNKALSNLQGVIDDYRQGDMSVVEKVGMIKFFEMAYELAWLTMKDYYEEQGEANIQGSKDAIRLGFKRGLITNGESWFDMVKSRRLSVHTYDESTADEIAGKISNTYINLFIQLQTRLNVEVLTS